MHLNGRCLVLKACGFVVLAMFDVERKSFARPPLVD